MMSSTVRSSAAARRPEGAYAALRAVLYADDRGGALRSAGEILRRVLEAAEPCGGPAAAAARAGRCAPPTAAVGAVRRAGERGWRPLVWLRPDQHWAAAYALESRCAVLVAGSAVPPGWEAR